MNNVYRLTVERNNAVEMFKDNVSKLQSEIPFTSIILVWSQKSGFFNPVCRDKRQ